MGPRHQTLPRLSFLLLIAGFIAAACAQDGPVAKVEPEPGALVGAVFVDADGDGEISAGDTAIDGVTIRAGRGTVRFSAEWSTATQADGHYRLVLPAAVDAGTVFVEAEFALTKGTTVSVRRPAVPGQRTDIGIAAKPQSCGSSACDGALLPDLVPVLESAGAAPTQPLTVDSWYIDTETQPDRVLLRFSSAAANVGDGPLHMVAGSRQGTGLETFQRVWTADFTYDDIAAGVFVFHPDHDHIHLDAFERYRLLSPDGNEVVASAKVSFCLVDTWPITPAELRDLGHTGSLATPIGQHLGVWNDASCGTTQQAINVGWADYYGAELPDQWIDITGVAPGEYLVEITVDPDGVLLELDESNNTVTFAITVP